MISGHGAACALGTETRPAVACSTDFTDLIDDNKPTDEDDSLLGMSGEDMLKKRSSGKRQPASYGSLEYFDE